MSFDGSGENEWKARGLRKEVSAEPPLNTHTPGRHLVRFSQSMGISSWGCETFQRPESQNVVRLEERDWRGGAEKVIEGWGCRL